MASLIKPGQIIRIIFLNTQGERVPRGTPGAIEKRWVNRKYYIGFREHGRYRRVPAFRDKAASQARLAEIVRRLEREEAGIGPDPFQPHLRRPLQEHLEEYLTQNAAEAGNPKYKSETARILRKALSGLSLLKDLTSDWVTSYLDGLTRTGAAPNTRKKHHSAVNVFCKWLFQRRRIPEQLAARVPIPRGGVQHRFRSLGAVEIKALLLSARNRRIEEATRHLGRPCQLQPETIQSLAEEGQERRLLYLVAITTGLRKEELARLRVGHLNLDGRPVPTIQLPAENTKGKRHATLLLIPAIARELEVWIKQRGLSSEDLLFRVSQRLHLIFQNDCRHAGIALETIKGRTRFRSLRKSANVLLRLAGVPLKERQLFMRHSDIRLTADTYDDAALEEMTNIVPAFEALFGDSAAQ